MKNTLIAAGTLLALIAICFGVFIARECAPEYAFEHNTDSV